MNLWSKVKRLFGRSNKPDPSMSVPCCVEYASGLDVKVLILDKDQPLKGDTGRFNGQVGNAQSLSFGSRPDGIGGTILFILYDSMEEFYQLLGKEKRLVLLCDCVGGKTITLYDGIVVFDTHINWGLSVDDIVIEIPINFTELSSKKEFNEVRSS